MLRSCVECGKDISSTVDKCIHCQGNPRGVKCRLCEKILPESKALGSGYSKIYYHSQCLEDFKAKYLNLDGIKWNCPECRGDLMSSVEPDGLLDSSLRSSKVSSPPYNCPFCGYSLGKTKPFEEKGKCSKCQLPVISGIHGYCEEVTQSQYRSMLNRESRFSPNFPCCHHPLCSTFFVKPRYVYLYYSKNGKIDKKIVPDDFTDTVQKTVEKEGCASVFVIILVFLGFAIYLYAA